VEKLLLRYILPAIVAAALLGQPETSAQPTALDGTPFPSKETFQNILVFLGTDASEKAIALSVYEDTLVELNACHEAMIGIVRWNERWSMQHWQYRQSEGGRELARSAAYGSGFYDETFFRLKDRLFSDLTALLPTRAAEVGWITDAISRRGPMGARHPRSKDLIVGLVDLCVPVIPGTPAYSIVSDYANRADILAKQRIEMTNLGDHLLEWAEAGDRERVRRHYEQNLRNRAAMRALHIETARRLMQIGALDAQEYDGILDAAYIPTPYEIRYEHLIQAASEAGFDTERGDHLRELAEEYATRSQSHRDELRSIYDEYFSDEAIAETVEEATGIAMGEIQHSLQFVPKFHEAARNAPRLTEAIEAQVLAAIQRPAHFTPGDPGADRLPLLQPNDVDDLVAAAHLGEEPPAALRVAIAQYVRDLDRAWMGSGVVGASHFQQEIIEPLLKWFRETRPSIDARFIESARAILPEAAHPAFDELLARGRGRRALAIAGQHSHTRHAWHLEDLIENLDPPIERTPEIDAIIADYRVAIAEAAEVFEDRLLALLPRYSELFSPASDANPRRLMPLLNSWYQLGGIGEVNEQYLDRLAAALGPERAPLLLTETLRRAYPAIFTETPVERLLMRVDETNCLTPEEFAALEPIRANYAQRQWEMRQQLMAAFDEWESASGRTARLNEAAKHNIIERWTEWGEMVHPAIDVWPRDNQLVVQTTRSIAQMFDGVRLAELPLDIQVIIHWVRDL